MMMRVRSTRHDGTLSFTPSYLLQTQRYWNITRQYFNESLLLSNIWSCYQSPRPFNCYAGTYNSGFRMAGTIWKPGVNSSRQLFGHPRSIIDCKYDIQVSSTSSQMESSLILQITSSQCTRLAEVNSAGGSAFEIFSITDDGSLSWCAIEDHFDGNYTVVCPSHGLCSNITVFLNYEHFLAVSEVASIQPALYHLLPPNTRLCKQQVNLTISPSSSTTNVYKHYHQYHGHWRRPTKSTHDETAEYLWTWDIFQGPIQFKSIDVFLRNRKVIVHLVGSSHMRETFLRMVDGFRAYVKDREKYFGGDDWGVKFNFVAYAIHQSNFFVNLCKELEDADSNVQHLSPSSRVLVLQTGDWDLDSYSSRVVIQDIRIGQRLIDIIVGILTGTVKCGRVSKFVYITPMPYPLCRRDGPSRCERKRGFRSNDAIAALRHFFLNGLNAGMQNYTASLRFNATNAAAALPLEIIDAFGIIRSRLLNPNDVFGVAHFLCRFNETGTLFGSPGGRVVVDGIILAVSGGNVTAESLQSYGSHNITSRENHHCFRCLET